MGVVSGAHKGATSGMIAPQPLLSPGASCHGAAALCHVPGLGEQATACGRVWHLTV